MLRSALLAVVACASLPCTAAPRQPFQDDGITVVPVDVTNSQPALFLKDDKGQPFRSFARLAAHLAHSGRTLRFAMNAGMYEDNGEPVGLLVLDGKIVHPLNRQDGKGNFYLKPNGVFAITRNGPRVVTTDAYQRIASEVRFATQSGPMLVEAGRINPALDPDWVKFTRNGVCAIGNTAYFVISDKPVSLVEFAGYFKNKLGCRDALYLDGNVSSLYSTALNRDDKRDGLGPLIGIAQ